MSKGLITVVGSTVVDLMSRTPHFPVPGETVLGGPFRLGPGGKGGNQAVAAARQGSQVYLVTKVGQDPFGDLTLQNYKNEHIDTSYVYVDAAEATGAALIAVNPEGENIIIVALGACGKLTGEEVERAEEAIKQSSIVLVQLETNMDAVQKTLELAEKHAIPVILNPAPYQEVPPELFKKISFITPNETEATSLTGIEVTDEQSALLAAKHLFLMGIPNVVITLGKKGCFCYNGHTQGQLYPSFEVEAVDTTGAGDAFSGGFAHALAAGQTVPEAIVYANAVAALSVTKVGTAPAMPDKAEVDHLLRREGLQC